MNELYQDVRRSLLLPFKTLLDLTDGDVALILQTHTHTHNYYYYYAPNKVKNKTGFFIFIQTDLT